MSQAFNLLVILGPTASGKTKLGVQLAERLNGEIISADSRQVYRGLDIGSGKDLEEYNDIPYHLIDIVDPGFEYNLFEFQKHFTLAFKDISCRQKLPLLVGGTGMYIDAIVKGYDMVEAPVDPDLRNELNAKTQEELITQLKGLQPGLHNTTDLEDKDRIVRAIEIALAEKTAQQKAEPYAEKPDVNPLVFGIQWDRDVLRKRITLRLKDRLEQGMIEEVEGLHAAGVSWDTLAFYGLEYRFLAEHLQGKLSRNDMFQKLNSGIHKFAKRQDTWFRKMERKGTNIHWLAGDKDPFAQASSILESMR